MKNLLLVILPVILFTGNIFSQTKDTLMLDGKISRKQVEKYTWFKSAYKLAVPAPAAMEGLRAHRKTLKKVRVVMVLGTWCSDSKEHVPAFFRVADEAGIPSGHVEIIAVSRKKVSKTTDVSLYGIEHVPTFIFYNGKAEIGRIVEEPEKSIAEDLLGIMKSQTAR